MENSSQQSILKLLEKADPTVAFEKGFKENIEKEKNSKDSMSDPELAKMVQRRMKELEILQKSAGAGTPSDALATKAAQNEPLAKELEQVTADLNTLLKNGDKDNK